METKKCGDCIHADVCEINEYLPEFSRENNAVGCLAFTDNGNFVEVVRCKDCVHQKEHRNGRFCDVWCMFNGMGDDGFCNYGKRKDK